MFRISENGGETQIYQTDAPQYPSDTLSFLDHDLNTSDSDYTYKITVLNSDTALENSDKATSIFLTVTSADKRLALAWTDMQPWNNIRYKVFRLNEHTTDWDSIATVSEPRYTDCNLENGKTYCYYIRAEGYYWLPDTVGPLWNRSQRECGVPYEIGRAHV